MTENEKSPFPPGLYEKITEYLADRFRLGKLTFIEKSSKISGSFLIGLILGFCVLMSLLLLGFGLSEYISFKNGDSFSGFFWVGISFLLILGIILLFKKGISKAFRNLIIRFLSKTLLDDESI